MASGVAAAQPIAFTGATVIDVEEGVTKPGMAVIVTRNRITAIGSEDEMDLPDGATVIDDTGKYIIPGLWDMHAHNVNDVFKGAPWDFHAPDSEDAEQREIYMPIYLASIECSNSWRRTSST